MEVVYWQFFVFFTVAGATTVFGARAGLYVAIGWSIFSVAMIYTSALMSVQLVVIWGTYFLFRDYGKKKQRISELESTLAVALLEYDIDTQSSVREAASDSRYEIIRNKQHMNELLHAIEGANTSLIILSGWIRSNVVDRNLVGLLRKALARGADVFIGYGWQGSDGTHHSDRSITEARQRLDKLARKASRERGWGQLTIREIPTHEKVLIKDQDYVICGSNNWLSNRRFKNQEQSIKIWDGDLAREMSDRYASKIS
jgi:phosphatidylserine/phosphatidylglycerophosphate/cardiolipin synthase-like enzyme